MDLGLRCIFDFLCFGSNATNQREWSVEKLRTYCIRDVKSIVAYPCERSNVHRPKRRDKHKTNKKIKQKQNNKGLGSTNSFQNSRRIRCSERLIISCLALDIGGGILNVKISVKKGGKIQNSANLCLIKKETNDLMANMELDHVAGYESSS